MRLWLAKKSEVPLREQLATQIVLGITSGDLASGERLPSTRELARRFSIHSNTVSAAYRELARRGWVEFRKGSGVYVRSRAGDFALEGDGLELDQLIQTFLQLARDRGFSLDEIRARVKHWLGLQPPDHFLVIEPDEELRRILIAEIKEATMFPVKGASPAECADERVLAGAAPVALYGQAGRVRDALPPGSACLFLHSRSVPESLEGQERPGDDALIAVVSHWPDFLRWSRTMLLAAQLDPDTLSFRDAREPGWQKGLKSSAFVITDALTASLLPSDIRTRVFRMLADSSLAELREYVKRFLRKRSDANR
ncbi:MAG TPA: GntR family transcriptional regulator [Pyrinomonadaceae bacterium]|jgi:GntR family transcriptional regulator